MLEQNGFIRWHKDLKLMAGGTYRGVNNYLNIQIHKRRCICGYLYEEHDRTYTGKNNYKNVTKHHFVQATYIRADGETNDEFEQAKELLNSFENRYGERIKVIVGGKYMSEGINLKYVQSVHIINPWHNLIQIEQTVGRGVRLCSHASMDDVESMSVKIFKYISIPPQAKLPDEWNLTGLISYLQEEGDLKLDKVTFNNKTTWDKNMLISNPSTWLSSDEFIYARALDKDMNIKQTERLLQQMSVDCYLNHDANINFPGDVDGSRQCNYGPCDYDCSTNFPKKITDKNIDTDTYTTYFMDPKVKSTELLIGQIFQTNWAFSLDSLLYMLNSNQSNKSNKSNKIDPDIVYLTLDKMLGDPPRTKPTPIIDKFGRHGHLIFRHPYYIFQPDEVLDENIPMYFREIPSAGIKSAISLSDILVVPKITLPSKSTLKLKPLKEKVGLPDEITPIAERDISPTRFTNTIENDLVVAKDNDMLTLSQKLDFYSFKQHYYVIKSRIEQLYTSNKNSSSTAKFILSYYLNNFIIANTNTKYDDNDIAKFNATGTWIYYIEDNGYQAFDGTHWSKVSPDTHPDIFSKIIKNKPNLKRLEKDVSDDFFGHINDDNLQNKKKFKIYDIKTETDKIRKKKYSEEIDQKSKNRGRVCSNFKLNEIKDFFKRLDIDLPKNIHNETLCWQIENELRKKDLSDKKFTWFLNFYDFRRKFPIKASPEFSDTIYKLYTKN
jgi:hypothetical protein